MDHFINLTLFTPMGQCIGWLAVKFATLHACVPSLEQSELYIVGSKWIIVEWRTHEFCLLHFCHLWSRHASQQMCWSSVYRPGEIEHLLLLLSLWVGAGLSTLPSSTLPRPLPSSHCQILWLQVGLDERNFISFLFTLWQAPSCRL